MMPSRNGACISESLSRLVVSLSVSSTTVEKIMVVAPTTAVPMSTGLEVALKVPAVRRVDASPRKLATNDRRHGVEQRQGQDCQRRGHQHRARPLHRAFDRQ